MIWMKLSPGFSMLKNLCTLTLNLKRRNRCKILRSGLNKECSTTIKWWLQMLRVVMVVLHNQQYFNKQNSVV